MYRYATGNSVSPVADGMSAAPADRLHIRGNGGCSLTPPHLRGEQEQIYQALENAVGNRITLQYPRTGEHLSAVMISDLDDDALDEAAVFYRKEGTLTTENALRLNLLDQADGQWMSVCDLPAEGAVVDRVVVSKIGKQERLIVGYAQVDQSDKVLVIYNYADGNLTKNFTVPYSSFDVADSTAMPYPN